MIGPPEKRLRRKSEKPKNNLPKNAPALVDEAETVCRKYANIKRTKHDIQQPKFNRDDALGLLLPHIQLSSTFSPRASGRLWRHLQCFSSCSQTSSLQPLLAPAAIKKFWCLLNLHFEVLSVLVHASFGTNIVLLTPHPFTNNTYFSIVTTPPLSKSFLTSSTSSTTRLSILSCTW